MLKKLQLNELGGGIGFIDIGASGGFPRAWQHLVPFINYYAFEPNKEECDRLQAEENAFNSAKYFPNAVADTCGEATLYMTSDMYCYSLLEPNAAMLDRFEFGPKFKVEGTEPLETVTLNDIPELKTADLDIIKVDSQGLDQRILESAPYLLERACYIEVEPGFNQSYIGEDTYAGLDTFLRAHGFRLFELTPHRIGRNNQFAEQGAEHGEMLWAESVWFKDYVGLSQENRLPEITRAKALKSLLICAAEKRLDFGFEQALLFEKLDLITAKERAMLENAEAWSISAEQENNNVPPASSFWTAVLRLFPWNVREKICHAAQDAVNQPHLFKG